MKVVYSPGKKSNIGSRIRGKTGTKRDERELCRSEVSSVFAGSRGAAVNAERDSWGLFGCFWPRGYQLLRVSSK